MNGNSKHSIIGLCVGIVYCVAFLSSCAYYSGEFVEVQKDHFSIRFPDYMSETDALHADAVLQYSSKFRNLYAVVFQDNKEEVDQSFLEYQQTAVNLIRNYEALESYTLSDSVYYQLDNDLVEVIQVEIFGTIDSETVYYHHAAIHTEDYFYQVVVWTRGQERKWKYNNDIQQIIQSFHTI